jgi:hypothetical protein
MADQYLWPGRLVTIDAGRHRGKTGTFLGHEVVQSGQTQLYPRVGLPDGTEVRVRTVTPVSREAVDTGSNPGDAS